MEPFLKSYYDHFKYKSIDSEQFKAFFLDYFKKEPKVRNSSVLHSRHINFPIDCANFS